MKQLAFSVKDFKKLFTLAEAPRTIEDFHLLDDAGKLRITSYCAVSGEGRGHRLDVVPSPRVLAYLKEALVVPGTIHFEAVFRSDGVLLIAKYSEILGSRWLALVDAATVPA